MLLLLVFFRECLNFTVPTNYVDKKRVWKYDLSSAKHALNQVDILRWNLKTRYSVKTHLPQTSNSVLLKLKRAFGFHNWCTQMSLRLAWDMLRVESHRLSIKILAKHMKARPNIQYNTIHYVLSTCLSPPRTHKQKKSKVLGSHISAMNKIELLLIYICNV